MCHSRVSGNPEPPHARPSLMPAFAGMTLTYLSHLPILNDSRGYWATFQIDVCGVLVFEIKTEIPVTQTAQRFHRNGCANVSIALP
jgi:hypothetical protein